MRGEVLGDKLLDQLDTEIGIVAGLDTMTDARNELVLLSHSINKLSWRPALVKSLGELLSSTIESTAESRADGKETSDPERRLDPFQHEW